MASSRLSALQHDFVEAFFLTGGAALAGYDLRHRFTDDLDVPLPIGVSLEDVERMRANLIERLLALAVPRE